MHEIAGPWRQRHEAALRRFLVSYFDEDGSHAIDHRPRENV
jgi:hypothetical protein